MLAIRFSPGCSRYINSSAITSWQTRFLSTVNETTPVPIDDDVAGSISDIDRNVSRLPADVYRHFKGKFISAWFAGAYACAG